MGFPGALITGIIGVIVDRTKWPAIAVTAVTGAIAAAILFYGVFSAMLC